MTLAEASERVGVTPATLRRWTESGLIPQHDGEWSPAAIGEVRLKGFAESTEVFIAHQHAEE